MISYPILVADDEPHNLAALRQILSPTYPLVFARSGQETLLAVAKHQPVLILLDVSMPDMDGYQVCRTLKAAAATEGIPIIFVTSLAEASDEAYGFDVGAVDYIVKPVNAAVVHARVKTHLSLVRATVLEKSYRAAISMLGLAGHYNDNDTGAHIWRMAAFSVAIARSVGWTDDDCHLLEMAAPMHDTGKIGIPDVILKKPGKLTDEEWVVMRSHAQIGYDILSRSDAPIFQLAAEVALSHHEKWDGSGYPHGARGEAIPASARIVAIADVFDALTMARPYKAAWTEQEAIAHMRAGRGAHFDPALLDAFFDIMPAIADIKHVWDETERRDGQNALP
ncbi:MAG: response regulator [Paludibacterium sp.]|uniref:HD domain-containing phosphohydrolase n=1 Tax=Paludibacterium sp. TaxID=1917523 RepID=UPI0025CEC231|nr:HD domain-containing phosphohydrolase [Paludibacterium sp.]MBV8046781.1 response regulator [Paludibacterium sp.]MBV8648925.1 response regulator [Paludibacterium sp.]